MKLLKLFVSLVFMIVFVLANDADDFRHRDDFPPEKLPRLT